MIYQLKKYLIRQGVLFILTIHEDVNREISSVGNCIITWIIGFMSTSGISRALHGEQFFFNKFAVKKYMPNFFN